MPLLINFCWVILFYLCVYVVFLYLVGPPWVRLGRASCTFAQKSSLIFQELINSSFFHTRKNQRTFPLTFIYFLFLILLLPSATRYSLFTLTEKKAHTEWEKISSFFPLPHTALARWIFFLSFFFFGLENSCVV